MEDHESFETNRHFAMKRIQNSQLESNSSWPGLIDSHIHLDSNEYQEDLEACIQRARQAGVEAQVLPSTDLNSSRRIQQLSQSIPGLYGAVGIHPHQAASFQPDSTPLELRQLAQQPGWVAIGETGLECHYDFCPIEQQVLSLNCHLDLAEELGLPLILHCRLAEPLLYEQLRPRQGRLSGVVHCFTGGWEWAQRFLDLGWHLGVGGLVTLPKAEEVHEVARRVPAHRWLLETDGPYLSPVPFRGYRNESCLLPLVASRIAHLRQQTVAEVVRQARSNARELFRLGGD